MREFDEHDFTPVEAKILAYLVREPGRIKTHEELIAEAGIEGANPLQSLRQFIHRIRLKVEDDPALPNLVLTHRGEGYSFQMR